MELTIGGSFMTFVGIGPKRDFEAKGFILSLFLCTYG